MGLSLSSTHKHIKIMLETGLCRMSGKNLCCTGINKLKRKVISQEGEEYLDNRILKVRVILNKRKQVLLFRYYLIKTNLLHQERAFKKRDKIIRICSSQRARRLTPRQHRLIERYGSLASLEKVTRSDLRLSNSKVGQLVNRSKKTAQRLCKQLKRVSLISTKSDIRKFGNFSPKDFAVIKMFKKNAIYNSNTKEVFLQYPNIYNLLPFFKEYSTIAHM
jgi:hypothetical protein